MVKWSHLEYERNSQKRLQLYTGKLPGSLFYLCGAIATESCKLEEKHTGNEKRRGKKGGFCQRFTHFHSSIQAETCHHRRRAEVQMMEANTELIWVILISLTFDHFAQIALQIVGLRAVDNLCNLQTFHHVRKCPAKKVGRVYRHMLVIQPFCQGCYLFLQRKSQMQTYELIKRCICL